MTVPGLVLLRPGEEACFYCGYFDPDGMVESDWTLGLDRQLCCSEECYRRFEAEVEAAWVAADGRCPRCGGETS